MAASRAMEAAISNSLVMEVDTHNKDMDSKVTEEEDIRHKDMVADTHSKVMGVDTNNNLQENPVVVVWEWQVVQL